MPTTVIVLVSVFGMLFVGLLAWLFIWLARKHDEREAEDQRLSTEIDHIQTEMLILLADLRAIKWELKDIEEIVFPKTEPEPTEHEKDQKKKRQRLLENKENKE